VLHAYVVFDNDAALFVCFSKEEAERVLAEEKARIREEVMPKEGAQQYYSQVQWTQMLKDGEEKVQVHFLHYHIVPVVSTTKHKRA
jgi:hypothetical protein